MSYNFLCFDTEDDSKELLESGRSGFLKQVTQIAAIKAGGNKFYNRGNVKEFLGWLKLQPEKFIYAHNLQYDLGNLFADDLPLLDCTLVGGRLIKAIWGNKTFVDSFNLWPMSAAKLGEAFGLKKLETKSMATDREYVFRDVEIIRQAILFIWNFCKEMGIDNVPATIGGLAVKVWKQWAGENCHDSSVLSRKAYYGGRVELFKRVNECSDVCYTDINSLYPYVMTFPFPAELSPVNDLPEHGIARITIKVPDMPVAPLPFRRKDGRIFYPLGTFEGTYTIPEINAAVKRGCQIMKVHEALGSRETMKPYQHYTHTAYAKRLASGTGAEKEFFKRLLNNLYGRLGTSGMIGRTVWVRDGNQVESNKVLVKYQLPLSKETNWSHAAYVTGYGRVALLDYIDKIGVDKMIYCDTDSCIFDAPGKQIPFEIGSQLGAMKLESWETSCETFAPKMYRAGDKYKAKGVPARLAKTFIETGHAEFDLPFKLREAIRFYDNDNSRRLSVWRKVEKENRQEYDRKNLRGNRYYPCHVSQIK